MNGQVGVPSILGSGTGNENGSGTTESVGRGRGVLVVGVLVVARDGSMLRIFNGRVSNSTTYADEDRDHGRQEQRMGGCGEE